MSEKAAYPSIANGRSDFDFLFGHWSIANRRLPNPLSGSDDWHEFEATAVEAPILGGMGNIEHYDAADAPKPIHAVAVRLYNQETGNWSIYWSTAGTGEFSIPTAGSFSNGVGTFYGKEHFSGRPTIVRFTWTYHGSNQCRWVQAFSPDNGKTWEDNWIMDFSRIGRYEEC